jgi:hypothetical protein
MRWHGPWKFPNHRRKVIPSRWARSAERRKRRARASRYMGLRWE